MGNKNLLSPEYVDEIRQRILGMDQLPTISTTFTRLMELLDNNSSSVKEIEQIVRIDQSLSSRILKLVNSPFYGFSNITSVSHAITMVGFKTLKNLVLGASASKLFIQDAPSGGPSAADFWVHSIGAAYISKVLSLQTGIGDAEDLFTLGLLHDIGKVMYLKEAPTFFQQLMDEAKNRKIALNRLENEVGISHSHLGWFLCEKWNFPSKISTVIKNHHNPSVNDEHTDEEAIVNLADYLTLEN